MASPTADPTGDDSLGRYPSTPEAVTTRRLLLPGPERHLLEVLSFTGRDFRPFLRLRPSEWEKCPGRSLHYLPSSGGRTTHRTRSSISAPSLASIGGTSDASSTNRASVSMDAELRVSVVQSSSPTRFIRSIVRRMSCCWGRHPWWYQPPVRLLGLSPSIGWPQPWQSTEPTLPLLTRERRACIGNPCRARLARVPRGPTTRPHSTSRAYPGRRSASRVWSIVGRALPSQLSPKHYLRPPLLGDGRWLPQ